MTALALTYKPASFARGGTDVDRATIMHTYAIAQTREIRPVEVHHWGQDTYARLVHLMSLNKGWDGGDSPAVRPEIATFAWSVLASVMTPTTPIPFIAPVSGGGLQIEWHSSGLDIEIYIAQPSHAELFIEYEDGRQRVEEDLSSDFGSLTSAVREIS